jgi:hypothetical protein
MDSDRKGLTVCITMVVLLTSACLAVAQDENLVPFGAPGQFQETSKRMESQTCSFVNITLPADFKVFAGGSYSGRQAGFQIDQSGHEATQIDVAINETEKPIVLMLGAYEPTIWNIGWTKGTNIVAVLASGYHRQVVAGLPKDKPILISTFDNQGACGYFVMSKQPPGGLNSLARRIFGRAVDMVYPAKDGKVVMGTPLTSEMRLVTSKDIPPQSFLDPNAPLAGPAGLVQAVAKGLLRPASEIDAEAWVTALMQLNPDRDVPPVAGQGKQRPTRPSLHRAYVILQAFQFPAGLYGGNLAIFYVPKGVPPPQGNPGHSTVYDFNTLTCRGAMCQ